MSDRTRKENRKKLARTAGAVGVVAGTILIIVGGGTEAAASNYVGIGVNAAVVVSMIISIFKKDE